MSPRSDRARAAVAAIVLAVLVGPVAAQDAAPTGDVEAFLERHGLVELRVRLLQDMLNEARRDERLAIAERLAPLYADLLEQARTPQRRAELVRRSRDLLAAVPGAESFDLRLSLLRVTYLQAEDVAERARLRLASPAETLEVRRTLSELASDFDEIGRRANRQALALQRREEAEGDVDRELIRHELRDARRHRSLAMYLAGWSNLYVAEMTGVAGRAREALTQFGWLLNAAPDEPPSLDALPEANLRFEHVARAAIGAAACYALLGRESAALDWFDTVARHEDVPPEVRAQLPARRIILLASLERWDELAGFLDRRRRAGPLPTSEARLLAVLALEAAVESDRNAALVEDLARAAVADLVARRDVAHIVDLASRYGAAPIGSTGFIAQYVRGIRAYDAAREAHRAASDQPESPASGPAVRRAYQQAARALRAALAAGDAGEHAATQGDAALYLGFSLYYGAGEGRESHERLLQAADAFQRAALLLEEATRLADARWMAIRAVSEAIDRSARNREALQQRLAALQSEFLSSHPHDRRVSTIMMQRAEAPGTPPREAVEMLLRVPESAPGWEGAQRRAARLLYDLYRRAPADRRDWAALRYAAVAEPILAVDQRRALGGDESSAARAAVRARRLLDALLSVTSPDADRAESALDAIEALIGSGRIDARDLRAELAYRRAQIALARDDIVTAEAVIDRLRAQAEREGGASAARALRFAEAGDHLLYNRAAQRWERARRSDAPQAEQLEAARAVVRRGARVAVDLDAASGDFSDQATLSLHATLAHAAYQVWSIEGDPAALRLADRLHRRLLEARPLDRGILRRTAELAEATGDRRRALDAWRDLASGLPPDSAEWFEARYRLISLLAKVDPARAAIAMRQHRALHPALGSPPWDERFEELESRLPEPPPEMQNAAPPPAEDAS